MFFSKKPESDTQSNARGPKPARANQRRHYRVRSSETEPIRASLTRERTAPAVGECVDLSIGGTWVEFARDPRLAQDEVCTLVIHADSQSESVKATSRVVTVRATDDGGVSVGFEFTNRIELYAQLDEFYARYFNRRRHVRAVPDFELKIPVRLGWRNGSFPTIARDISEGGLGVLVPLDKAKELERIDVVDLVFRLPGQRADIECRATIRSRTVFSKACLLGLEFDPDGAIRDHLLALRRCVEKHQAACKAWKARMAKGQGSRRAS
jgi:c-di-GMP-binding flagellar brake protein YcgR